MNYLWEEYSRQTELQVQKPVSGSALGTLENIKEAWYKIGVTRDEFRDVAQYRSRGAF